MPRKSANKQTFRVPPYRCHKASWRGIVQYKPLYGTKPKYLPGAFQSAESVAAYQACCQEILAHQMGTARDRRREQPLAELTTVTNLAAAYLHWAEGHYGAKSKEYGHLDVVGRMLNEIHGPTLLRQFGPIALKEVRQAMIRRGWSRVYVNQQTNRIRRVVRWGVEAEFCDGVVLANLQAVPGLRRGKTEARESRPVAPVAWRDVRRVLPFLPRLLRIAVRVQWRTGMRSDELLKIRPCDISDGVYRPPSHKTAWRGKTKLVCLGPRARRLLSICQPDSPDGFFFTPAAVVREHSQRRARMRRSKLYAADRKRPRRIRLLRDRYDSHAFQQAINHAFAGLAKSLGHRRPKGVKLIPWLGTIGVEHWHPHQLRHSRATIIRARYGVEAAQSVIGNSLSETQLYAERSLNLAVRIAAETG